MAIKLSALRAAPAVLYPQKYLALISVRDRVDHRARVRSEGFGQLENQMISLGIEPAAFRLVA
jgi:hypothetical protein